MSSLPQAAKMLCPYHDRNQPQVNVVDTRYSYITGRYYNVECPTCVETEEKAYKRSVRDHD